MVLTYLIQQSCVKTHNSMLNFDNVTTLQKQVAQPED